MGMLLREMLLKALVYMLREKLHRLLALSPPVLGPDILEMKIQSLLLFHSPIGPTVGLSISSNRIERGGAA